MEMEQNTEKGAPGIVALSTTDKSNETGEKVSGANCYEDGCFHGCVDSCECIDACDTAPDL